MKLTDYYQTTMIRVRSNGGTDAVAPVREQIAQGLAGSGHVVLDLRGIAADTSLIGVVLSLQRRLELNGRLLVVVARQQSFYRLLERLGVTESLTVFRDTESAAAFVGAHPVQQLAA